MKKIKTLSAFFMVIILALSFSVQSFAEVTSAKTMEHASLKWVAKVGNGWAKPAGSPLVLGENIVVMSGDEIMMLSSYDGSVIKKATASASQSYGYTTPTYADGKIFMPLSQGIVEAFDVNSLQSVWTYTDSLGGKGLTSVTYSDGYVYTGFWNSETAEASFICLDASNGELQWSKSIDGGLYWAGAYCNDKAVIFGTDDGNDKIAHIYSLDKTTGEEIGSISLENKGDIRSSAAYYNSRIYFTTKGGYIISLAVDDLGAISDLQIGEIGAASTSTPVIYNSVIYIGAADKSIKAIDTQSLSVLYSVSMPAYPQCTLLLSTAFEISEGYLYVYSTYNSNPGGVTLIKIPTVNASADSCIVSELYNAKGYENYCISNIVCDDNATLYYKNDSGYLFALEEKKYDINVTISDSRYILPKTDISIHCGLANEYGYTNDTSVDKSEITVLDALVAAHIELLGDMFTPETANEYLSVSEYGYIEKILGEDASSSGFAVNGKAPHDDVLTQWGYTGYTAAQAVLNSGDDVHFFFYQDTTYYLDNYSFFTKNGENVAKVSANIGDEISLGLKGYCYAYYSNYSDDMIESLMMQLSDAIICTVDEYGSITPLNATDEDGEFTLSFDTPGKYYITAIGSEDISPIIMPLLEIEISGISYTVEDGNCIITYCFSENTPCSVYVASYIDDTMTDVIYNRYILSGDGIEIVDISSLGDEDKKVIILNDALCPLE